jgi:hypothetical protein
MEKGVQAGVATRRTSRSKEENGVQAGTGPGTLELRFTGGRDLVGAKMPASFVMSGLRDVYVGREGACSVVCV